MTLNSRDALIGISSINKWLDTIENVKSTAFAAKMAAIVADKITDLAAHSYDSGTSVFGDPRVHHTGAKNNGPRKGPKGKRKYKGRNPDGKRKGPTSLSLVRSGVVRSHVKFTTDGGTKLRAVLTTKYARYLIGKFGVLPNSKAAMPTTWKEAIRAVTQPILKREFSAPGGLA